MQEMTTGPALDAAACQALHRALTAAGKPELARAWEPKWMLVDDYGPCYLAHPDEEGAQPIYPAISSDGNVMLRALEHMRELGWLWYLQCRVNGVVCELAIDYAYTEYGDTAPEAVARAVVAALGGVNEC